VRLAVKTTAASAAVALAALVASAAWLRGT